MQLLREVPGRRQRAAVPIDAPMRVASFYGVGGVGPLALNPLQVGQARAVLVLVDHAGRHQRTVRRRSSRREHELGLLRNSFESRRVLRCFPGLRHQCGRSDIRRRVLLTVCFHITPHCPVRPNVLHSLSKLSELVLH